MLITSPPYIPPAVDTPPDRPWLTFHDAPGISLIVSRLDGVALTSEPYQRAVPFGVPGASLATRVIGMRLDGSPAQVWMAATAEQIAGALLPPGPLIDGFLAEWKALKGEAPVHGSQVSAAIYLASRAYMEAPDPHPSEVAAAIAPARIIQADARALGKRQRARHRKGMKGERVRGADTASYEFAFRMENLRGCRVPAAAMRQGAEWRARMQPQIERDVAEGHKFVWITLTVARDFAANGSAAFVVAANGKCGPWRRLLAAIKKRYGPFKFVRALEEHTDGYPHVHALIRCTAWADDLERGRRPARESGKWFRAAADRSGWGRSKAELPRDVTLTVLDMTKLGQVPQDIPRNVRRFQASAKYCPALPEGVVLDQTREPEPVSLPPRFVEDSMPTRAIGVPAKTRAEDAWAAVAKGPFWDRRTPFGAAAKPTRRPDGTPFRATLEDLAARLLVDPRATLVVEHEHQPDAEHDAYVTLARLPLNPEQVGPRDWAIGDAITDFALWLRRLLNDHIAATRVEPQEPEVRSEPAPAGTAPTTEID